PPYPLIPASPSSSSPPPGRSAPPAASAAGPSGGVRTSFPSSRSSTARLSAASTLSSTTRMRRADGSTSPPLTPGPEASPRSFLASCRLIVADQSALGYNDRTSLTAGRSVG